MIRTDEKSKDDGLKHSLETLAYSGGTIMRTQSGGWHLEIPAGPAGSYRLAQIDDYHSRSRKTLLWHPPLKLILKGRASSANILGTWGFGFWNDPFSFSIGFGSARRLPALPETAWFFFASPPNYLSLRDDLPAVGGLAGTFHSRAIPAPLLALMTPLLPFAATPHLGRLIRRAGRQVIFQDAAAITIDVVQWHTYNLTWEEDFCLFEIDGEKALVTNVAPRGPLGFVLWVDNQYASLPPSGQLGFGALISPESYWIEVDELTIIGL